MRQRISNSKANKHIAEAIHLLALAMPAKGGKRRELLASAKDQLIKSGHID